MSLFQWQYLHLTVGSATDALALRGCEVVNTNSNR